MGWVFRGFTSRRFLVFSVDDGLSAGKKDARHPTAQITFKKCSILAGLATKTGKNNESIHISSQSHASPHGRPAPNPSSAQIPPKT